MALIAHTRPRGLIASLLALAILAILLPAPGATARNLYEMTDSSEGDPGDGVLRPVPAIDLPVPTPKPSPVAYTVLCFTVDTCGDYRFDQPVVVFLPAAFVPRSLFSGQGMLTMLAPEGRWHDAP